MEGGGTDTPRSVTPSAVWNKREEKAGYYVYPAFFAPGEERKEKYDIFCKKRVDKRAWL